MHWFLILLLSCMIVYAYFLLGIIITLLFCKEPNLISICLWPFLLLVFMLIGPFALVEYIKEKKGCESNIENECEHDSLN